MRVVTINEWIMNESEKLNSYNSKCCYIRAVPFMHFDQKTSKYWQNEPGDTKALSITAYDGFASLSVRYRLITDYKGKYRCQCHHTILNLRPSVQIK